MRTAFSLIWLAIRAEVSRSGSHDYSLDGATAIRAWFALASVYGQAHEVLPGLAVRQQIGKIIQSGAARIDRRFEDLARRFQ